MGRRDIQFYDLHKLNEPQQEVIELKRVGLHTTEGAYDADVYEDIEVKDFNTLFTNEGIIAEQFGQSISVKIRSKEDEIMRQVKEDLSKVKLVEQIEQRQVKEYIDQDDQDLQVLQDQLYNLRVKFKRTKAEISEIYVMVSGNVTYVREYLTFQDNKKGTSKKPPTWNVLEDLALAKPEESPEFMVLLQEKGWKEIAERRLFLKAKPVYLAE